MSKYGNFKMKKSFSLLITLVLISLFSFLGIFLIEIKAMGISNVSNLYLQTQSKLHLNFFKDYIKSLDLKSECIKTIELKDDIYILKANLEYENECINSNQNIITIDIFINSKTKIDEINLHEKFQLNL